jgi:hypothetical protein
MSDDPMQLPNVTVLHVDSVSESDFAELKMAVQDEGMRFHSESYKFSPQAGVEWLLPTALAVFFFKSYFDGIFKEIGKDHYCAMKAGLKPLWSRLLGPAAPKMVVVGTQGKVRAGQPYSLMYSIVAEAGPQLRFKLMFPSSLSAQEYEEAVAAFFLFLKDFHGQSLADSMVVKLQSARILSGTVLLVYDQAEAALRVVDPLSRSPSGG